MSILTNLHFHGGATEERVSPVPLGSNLEGLTTNGMLKHYNLDTYPCVLSYFEGGRQARCDEAYRSYRPKLDY